MNTDLFPETKDDGVALSEQCQWFGSSRDKWDYPLVTVKLLPVWNAEGGWKCGWLIHIANSLDEWTPLAPDVWKRFGSYPWHRPDTMAQSNKASIAMASAAREARMVIEQMFAYTPLELHQEVREVSDQIEIQLRKWLTEPES